MHRLAVGMTDDPATDLAPDPEIVQQEVFGPVLAALPFETDDAGLQLANDTPYGGRGQAPTAS